MDKDALTNRRVIKLEEILVGYDIYFFDLKNLAQGTWKHMDEESING